MCTRSRVGARHKKHQFGRGRPNESKERPVLPTWREGGPEAPPGARARSAAVTGETWLGSWRHRLRPTHTEEGAICFIHSTYPNVNLCGNTLADTLRNTVYPAPGCPGIQQVDA